ncbi:hypothetical protein JHW43_009651, partial [Diplocarpon mali]
RPLGPPAPPPLAEKRWISFLASFRWHRDVESPWSNSGPAAGRPQVDASDPICLPTLSRAGHQHCWEVRVAEIRHRLGGGHVPSAADMLQLRARGMMTRRTIAPSWRGANIYPRLLDGTRAPSRRASPVGSAIASCLCASERRVGWNAWSDAPSQDGLPGDGLHAAAIHRSSRLHLPPLLGHRRVYRMSRLVTAIGLRRRRGQISSIPTWPWIAAISLPCLHWLHPTKCPIHSDRRIQPSASGDSAAHFSPPPSEGRDHSRDGQKELPCFTLTAVGARSASDSPIGPHGSAPDPLACATMEGRSSFRSKNSMAGMSRLEGGESGAAVEKSLRGKFGKFGKLRYSSPAILSFVHPRRSRPKVAELHPPLPSRPRPATDALCHSTHQPLHRRTSRRPSNPEVGSEPGVPRPRGSWGAGDAPTEVYAESPAKSAETRRRLIPPAADKGEATNTVRSYPTSRYVLLFSAVDGTRNLPPPPSEERRARHAGSPSRAERNELLTRA